MKKSNDYINEKTFKTNKKYADLQNKTEELFFQCLEEGESVEYFYKKIDEIWGNIDHSFIQREIEEYANLIERDNLYYIEQETGKKAPKIPYTPLIIAGIGLFAANEEKFKNIIKKRYKTYYNSPAYKNDKKEYLKRKVKNYDNQVIPYFNKDGEVVRYVKLSTYLSMKYNTEMTRAGWQRTIEDAEYLGYTKFWIPPHAFSCTHCAEYQGKILSLNEVLDFSTRAEAEETEGDILHPNCKCQLLLYTRLTRLERVKMSMDHIEEYYNIRQKVNSLTLKKERLLTDKRVQNDLGNPDEIDKLNNQIKKVNTQIRDLQNSLPTKEMRKKVIAINR